MVGYTMKINTNNVAGSRHKVINTFFCFFSFIGSPFLVLFINRYYFFIYNFYYFMIKGCHKFLCHSLLSATYCLSAASRILSAALTTLSCQSFTVLSPETTLSTALNNVSRIFTPSTVTVFSRPPITALAPLS